MKWNETKWNQIKSNEIKSNQIKSNEIMWNQIKEQKRNEMVNFLYDHNIYKNNQHQFSTLIRDLVW